MMEATCTISVLNIFQIFIRYSYVTLTYSRQIDPFRQGHVQTFSGAVALT